jgi:ribosome-binding factor A
MAPAKKSQRGRRVDEVLRQVVSDALLRRADPRLRGVAVTGVDASRDVAYADVHVQLAGNEHRREKAMAALEASRPGLQAQINAELHLRRTPVLRFHHDASFDRALRIEQILHEHVPAPDDEAG